MKLMVSARKSSKSNGSSRKKIRGNAFLLCLRNEGYPASLEKRKIYIALRDSDAEKQGLLRIVDESGEAYLYPKAAFRPIALPQGVKRAVLAA